MSLPRYADTALPWAVPVVDNVEALGLDRYIWLGAASMAPQTSRCSYKDFIAEEDRCSLKGHSQCLSL